jgi:biopolymer transport protein ExbD
LALCASAVVAAAACAKKRPVPDAGPCRTALLGVLDRVASHEPPDPLQWTALACSELYRHAACGDAWKRELAVGAELADASGIRPIERLPEPARIARECAKAYCAELSSKPALCSGPPPSENESLVKALGELDTAILAYELGESSLAEGLALRARLFRSVTVPMETAPLPVETKDAGATLTLSIAADESIELDGRTVPESDLERELGKLDGLSNRRAVIRADRKASHGRVIEVMDALKRAGVKKIAFAVNPSLAPPTPSARE